jgi:hypothetical protein
VIGVPVKRHHVREIVGAHIDASAIPIEDSDIVVAPGPRPKNVPDVRTAVDDRDIAPRNCSDILDGQYDDMPAFYFSGDLAGIQGNTGLTFGHAFARQCKGATARARARPPDIPRTATNRGILATDVVQAPSWLSSAPSSISVLPRTNPLSAAYQKS